jgi:hypothetical protein
LAGWAAALTAGLIGCLDCDRDGCEALTDRAPPLGTGIAGVVAHLSDVVIDNCQACPLGQATLELWAVDARVGTEAAARSLIAARGPDVTASVSGHYVHPLEAGRYLLCVRPSCVDLTLPDGQTLTVNLQRRDGPTGFLLPQSNGAPVGEDLGFDVGY